MKLLEMFENVDITTLSVALCYEILYTSKRLK